MLSKISYNIHAQGVKNTEKLLNHLRVIKPRAVVVMDGLALARVIKSQNPETIVIHREWPDDDIYLRQTPSQWLASKRSQVGTDDIWLYTTNEPGYDEKIIRWHEELLKLNFASINPLRLVILNISSGVPKPEEWNKADALLKLASKHRDKVIIGLHEYWGGIATSGFIGGTPEDVKYHPNYTVRSNWPNKAAAKDLTKYHCGRFKFMVDYCNTNNIAPPRVILTEHGPDAMGDIDSWLKSLRMTSPYNTIRGFKTLQNQWRIWFPDWSHEQSYLEQLKYLSENIYTDSPVEAQMVFCYGHTAGGQWEQFDVEGSTEFIGLLEKYVTSMSAIQVPDIENAPNAPNTPIPDTSSPDVISNPGTIPTPNTVPIPENLPNKDTIPTTEPPLTAETVPSQMLPEFPPDFDTRSIEAVLSSISGSKVNIRSKPSTSSTIMGTLLTPIKGRYIPLELMKSNEVIAEIINGYAGFWMMVSANGVKGWIFNPFVKIETIKQPDPVPNPPTTPILDNRAEIEKVLKQMEDELSDLKDRLNGLESNINKLRDLLK